MSPRRWWRRPSVTVLVLVALAGAAFLVDRWEEDDDEPAVTSTEDTAPGEEPEPEPPAEGEVVTIKRISDGDSFDANLASGRTAEVRMIGINAPEWGECLYRESRSALSDMLRAAPEVVLQRDVSNTDQYGRWLRYVVAAGVFANQEMLERGLALTITTRPDTTREPELAAAQARARSAGLGIWNPNACGGAATMAVQVVEVEEDPPGRDQDDLNGEYVVIANHGESPLDMTGWKLRDDSTRNRFWFPEGFTLQPGRSVTVHVGAGDDTDDALYWGRRYPVWGNARDTALLLDPNGNIVSYVDVGSG